MIVTHLVSANVLATNASWQTGRARASCTKAIVAFFGATFAWSWSLWWLASRLQTQQSGLSGVLFVTAAFGPGLSALVVTFAFEGRAGVLTWVHRCLRWRIGWWWYALAFAAPPVLMLSALAIHAALGADIPPSAIAGHIPIAIAQFALVAVIGGPLGEEFGWRGYALPALSAKMGWRLASVIIGVIWSAWHLPLFFMSGTAQGHLPIIPFLLSTVSLSVIFASISVGTRFSVMPALLLHTTINWWSLATPVMPVGSDVRAYWLVVGLTVVVAAVASCSATPAESPQVDHLAPCS